MNAASDERGAYRIGPARLWLCVWRLLDGHNRRLLWTAFGAMVGSAALRAAVPVLIGVLIDRSLTGEDGVDLGHVGPYILAIALVVVVQQLLEVARRQLVENVGTALERDNRSRVCRHLLRVDLDQLRGTRVGKLYGRANRSIEGTTKLLKLGAMDLLPALVTALAALAVALGKNVAVGLAMMMVVPTGFAIVRRQVRSQAGIRVQLRDHKDEIDGQVIELLPLLDSVRAVGTHAHFTDRVGAACDKLRATELRHHRAMSLYDAAKFLNEGFWLLAVLWVALSVSGSHSAGEVTTYVLLFSGVLMPLRELHRIIDEASESSLQARDLLNLLDEPEDVGFQAAREPSGDPAGTTPAIDFQSVGFTYPESSTPVLEEIDLTVSRGERVGIVGPNGCGKSTLLRILRRFHHGFEGSIGLFGEPLDRFDHDRLAADIGYVSQVPGIVVGTLRENIDFGLGASEEEIHAAAARARIHEDIVAMPGGYQRVIGERGDTLSGGQRQRICIARSLLRNPPLLLLDEPTSSLDSLAERHVQATIDGLEGTTVLMVAHRLRTLRNFDRIVVLGEGRVAEEGTFAQLAARPGIFRGMLEEQESDGERGALAA